MCPTVVERGDLPRPLALRSDGDDPMQWYLTLACMGPCGDDLAGISLKDLQTSSLCYSSLHLLLVPLWFPAISMATINKTLKHKTKPGSAIKLVMISITTVALFFLFSSVISTGELALASQNALASLVRPQKPMREHSLSEKYLYWGDRIDCPGKHCDSCEGLGHQESSLRCALEEAMFLNR